MKKINVLSLFGGIECGRMALNEMGIVPENYFSSEIDEYSISNSKHNFPDVVHIGSVTGISCENIRLFKQFRSGCDFHYGMTFDLLIGGSPCQDISVAGAQK